MHKYVGKLANTRPCIRGFPKIELSGIYARIVSKQNKFSKKKLPLTGTLDTRTVVVVFCVQSQVACDFYGLVMSSG